MKTRILNSWLLGMVLTIASVTSGCAQDGVNATAPANTSDTGKATPSATNSGVVAQPSPATPTAFPLRRAQLGSPAASLSPWAQEIERLVLAGVDERVVTSYITNTAGIFNLTADQIIYLKKEGVSPGILSAMIQHDQHLFPGVGPLAPPSAAPAAPMAPVATPSESPMVADTDLGTQQPFDLDDSYYAPEQPQGLGPVRAPYPVKLNDPIIMLQVPTFRVPCW